MTENKSKSLKHRNADAYDPRDFIIAGHDTPPDPTDPLYDPDRVALLSQPRNRNNIDSIKAGVPVPAIIGVKRMHDAGDGLGKRERIFVKEGRQRTFDARIAAVELEAKGEAVPFLSVILHNGMTDDDHAIGVGSYNNLGYRESTMTKVRRAAWLNGRCQGRPDRLDVIKRALNLTSVQSVRGYLRLAEADPLFHKAVEEGRISASAASVLALIPRDAQAAALKNVLGSGMKASEDCWAFVRAMGLKDEDRDASDPTDEDEAHESKADLSDASLGPSSEPEPPKKAPKAKPKADPNEDLKGRAPKRVMVRNIVKRATVAASAEGVEAQKAADLELAIKVMRYVSQGEAPPACLAPYVRAEKDAAKKKAENKAGKGKK